MNFEQLEEISCSALDTGAIGNRFTSNQSYKKWEVKFRYSSVFIPWLCVYVCMYVCVCVSSPQPTSFKLGTWNLDIVLLLVIIWGRIFFVFWIFHFFQSYAPFFIFSLYILCIFLLSAYRSQFFTWELNFWYEGTLGLD